MDALEPRPARSAHRPLSRRSLLAGGLGAGTVAAAGLAAPSAAFASSDDASANGLRTDPFTLGVASGDPWPDGFVLWTRLALDPLAEDGLGGMPPRPVEVQWEVAEDAAMRAVVARGTAVALIEDAHSVHVELMGLRAGREYFYRFRAGRHLSAVGRTLTAPAPHEMPAALTMSFASCAQYEHGYFTAYRRMAEDQPDLILHLGDYAYEYRKNVYTLPGGNIRHHDGPETVTLAGYRQRHAQYKSDADLQAAHAMAPWAVVWDDHEVDNNWAAGIPENSDPGQMNDTAARFLERRAAAFKAYYENMPLRASAAAVGSDMQIYRRLAWGRLANFHMLDTRQYRDDQLAGDGWRENVSERFAESRTITGAAQERWLLDGFRASEARWDVLGQQVFFSERDRDRPLEVDDVSMDGWDGYAASRRRITQGWIDAGVRNAVVLTGDVHRHWASDIRVDFKDTDAPVVGSELVCSSVTSNGDGSGSTTSSMMEWNPHLKYYSDRRGYVRTRITASSMSADFRVLDRVSTPGAAATTQASFEIADGTPGLVPTA
ncbi:alkaline phosphatase D family protein [Sinomonas halotolerans]|uniref:Alkaline phosphatase D family protein n=1 Tax=Sinomonas halotolerans TaxID=1644133 RepID=A0ABU9X3G7_9MICC